MRGLTWLLILVLLSGRCHAAFDEQTFLPRVQTTALDGHAVSLPRDLSPMTVFLVGFSRGSADATTAWEIPLRTKLASATVGVYDVAMLASLPGFLRGWVTRSIRGKVPPALHRRFLPLFADEASWKQICGFDPKQPDAPYVLLVDRSGRILWRTHEAYSAGGFAELGARVKQADVGAR